MVLMERSEPALVPEWLKGSNAGMTGGGSSAHHFAASMQSDDHHTTVSTRNRLAVSLIDHDSPRSLELLYGISPSHFRRSSSNNGSMMLDKEHGSYSRSSSSFGRGHWDRDREKDLQYRENERFLLADHHDFSDSLALLTSKLEKDSLRRSKSMISGRRCEVWPKKVEKDMNSGPHVGGSNTSILTHNKKSSFERDFPSLGPDEKPAVPEIARVTSTVLGTACQSLPMCSSTVIGGDGWTSALAEVPVIMGGSNLTHSSVPQTARASSSTVPPSMGTGLNMAETLAQTPVRVRAAPQLSDEIQRLEELAIKQSRQLIPVTPSMPKILAPSSSEKPKTKLPRTGELSTTSKVGQQASPSQLVNHAFRAPARTDILKHSQSSSKLLVLKGRENSNFLATAVKEAPSPTSPSQVSLGVVPPSAAFGAPLRSSNIAKGKSQSSSVPDKRPLSHVQDRNDFFNSLRKKVSSVNTSYSSATSDSSSVVSQAPSEKCEGDVLEGSAISFSHGMAAAAVDRSLIENGGTCVNGDFDTCEKAERFPLTDGEKGLCSDAVVDPDEEEAAFLRSLGWDENAGEEEALTEEEIKGFYEEYMKLRPSTKLLRELSQLPLQSRIGSLECFSSELSSSDSESKA